MASSSRVGAILAARLSIVHVPAAAPGSPPRQRQSTGDAFYRGGHIRLVAGNSSDVRTLGSEADIEAGWQLERHIRVAASGKDVHYASVWLTCKF